MNKKAFTLALFSLLFVFVSAANRADADPVVCTAPACFDFSSDSQYSNNNPPTSGLFRDVIRPETMNRGTDTGGTGHTALRFSSLDVGSAGATSLTVFDLDPTNTTPTVFVGSQHIAADVLFTEFNNARELGMVTLFNESAGTGPKGLFLGVSDAGNTEFLRLRTIFSDGFHFPSPDTTVLAEVNLSANHILLNNWYTLDFDLTITGDSFNVVGKVFNHSDPLNPNSARGAQVVGTGGSTLNFQGSLSALGLTNTGECGLAMRQQFNEATNHGSISEYVNCNLATLQGPPIPEPSTISLLGLGLLGAAMLRRRLRRN